MRYIKIFLASSKELIKDRVIIASLVTELNSKFYFNKQDIRFDLIKWEYFPTTVTVIGNQLDYNNAIEEDTDIFIAIFGQGAAKITVEECEVALKVKELGKPIKLFCLIKETRNPEFDKERINEIFQDNLYKYKRESDLLKLVDNILRKSYD